MREIKRNSRVSTVIGRACFIIAVLFLLVYLLTVFVSAGNFFDDAAEDSARQLFDIELTNTQHLAEAHYDNLYKIVEKVQNAVSHEAVSAEVSRYIGSELFGTLRFYANNSTYSADGSLLGEGFADNDLIRALVDARKQGCTETFYYAPGARDCIAFYVPVTGSVYIDGLLSIVPARNIVDFTTALGEKTAALLLVDTRGQVLTSRCVEGFPQSIGNSFSQFVSDFTTDKSSVSAVTDMVRQAGRMACSIDTVGGEYTIVAQPVDVFSNHFALVAISDKASLVTNASVYMRHIVTLIIIAVISLSFGAAYAFSYYRKMRSALDVAGLVDPLVGCANAEQFRSVASGLLQSRRSRFAVMTMDIRQYRLLSEKLPKESMTDILKYVAKVIETFCPTGETYGYAGDGRFLQLIQYSGERSIRDRVRLIETVVTKHAVLGKSKAKMFNIGVCLTTGEKQTIEELIDCANVACNTARNNVNSPFQLYTAQVNAERDHNDRIESEMESALMSGDFRLFLQPKYNVSGDRVDSAEALVRWFDPKTGDYRFPGEFIGLFETNGFITKLDHFMYIEVLKLLSDMANRGEKVVPISVNVSLVTANAPDFLNFYIENKKKYRVGDNFITIEFTESFAMRDYGQIREIVDKLHKNGIRCSLDDFGSGYASFGVLKNIPIDELKLDRLFLAEGVEKRNDDTLLQTVITLAKQLGVAVVQEGVETKEVFDKVVSMGCDVIQGYYYARAIPVEEYKLFVNSNTSIKFKALVK